MSPSTTLRNMLLACAAGLSGLAAIGGPAAAQILLYENRLPDGYAYVRFVNTLPDAVTITPDGFADPVALGAEGASRISAYYTVEDVKGRSLKVDVKGGEISGKVGFELKPGLFHTVLVGKDEKGLSEQVVADQAEISQTRARLAFYNALPDCTAAGLQLDPGGQSVFTGVPPKTMRGRNVNPAAKALVRASCSGTKFAPVDLGQLDAGGQYSVWLISPSGTPLTFLSKNTMAPYLR